MTATRGSLCLVLLGAGLAGHGLLAAGGSRNYTGSGSCSSVACHGSPRPRAGPNALLNEHTVWVTQDQHAQAYAHLKSERSRVIARNLKMAQAPETDARCLDCHALNAPQNRRGRSFDLADGVSCEACHGPAEEWLGSHTAPGWTHAQSVAAGMRDMRDPLSRAEACATCHVGSPSRLVDHELHAAGHPELVFEMQWSSAAMPRHWREPADKGPYFTTRLWAVGMAVHLRDQMARTAKAAPGGWPDFAAYDCGSCHHELENKSWRRERGYEGRRAGDPPLDLTRWRVLAPVARRLGGDAVAEIDAAVRALGEAADPSGPAQRIARAADALGRRLNDPSVDLGRETTLALLTALASDPSSAREFGYRGAGQFAMSLDSLSRPLAAGRDKADEGIDPLVGRLFATLKDPRAYDPEAFAAAMEAISSRLKQAGPR